MPSILIAVFAFVIERPVPGLFWENETEQVNRRNSTANIEDRLITGLRAANLKKVWTRRIIHGRQNDNPGNL